MKSKIGTTFSVIYLVLVILIWINEYPCNTICYLGSSVMGLPWTFSGLAIGKSIILSQLLNAVILYFIGFGISKIISHFRNKKLVINK